MSPEPKICFPVSSSAPSTACSALLVILLDIAMITTPPKDNIIAITSKGVIVSLRKSHPKRVAQNGAVLKMVF